MERGLYYHTTVIPSLHQVKLRRSIFIWNKKPEVLQIWAECHYSTSCSTIMLVSLLKTADHLPCILCGTEPYFRYTRRLIFARVWKVYTKSSSGFCPLRAQFCLSQVSTYPTFRSKQSPFRDIPKQTISNSFCLPCSDQLKSVTIKAKLCKKNQPVIFFTVKSCNSCFSTLLVCRYS